MRIGVIRGDLPSSVFVGDIETISQYDPGIEPVGQTFYIGRPTVSHVEEVMASSAGAAVRSSAAPVFPLTVNAGNQTLRVRSSATGAFSVITVATGVYATLAALVTAVKTAIGGLPYDAFANANLLVLESKAYGVASFLEVDTVANGSTLNTPVSFPAGVRTMPSAASIILATLPVGGPLNVSIANLDSLGAGTSAGAFSYFPVSRGVHNAIADAIAVRVYNTPIAIKSFQVGQIAGYLSTRYNPDPNRMPLANGPAISVVADDGVTPLVAPTPAITTAVIGGGALTITGVGLGSDELFETHVKVSGACSKVLPQGIITSAGGSVSSTSIVIPLSLLPGVAATTCSAQVKVMSLASASATIT